MGALMPDLQFATRELSGMFAISNWRTGEHGAIISAMRLKLLSLPVRRA
jgi:hypothetical protein